MSSAGSTSWRPSRSCSRSWSTTVRSFHCDRLSPSMLTLPSRIHSTEASSRRLSNGSTRIECRGFTPAGGSALRPARPIVAPRTARATAAAARTSGRRALRLPGSAPLAGDRLAQLLAGLPALARLLLQRPHHGAGQRLGALGPEPLDRRPAARRCAWRRPRDCCPGTAGDPPASRRRRRRARRDRSGCPSPRPPPAPGSCRPAFPPPRPGRCWSAPSATIARAMPKSARSARPVPRSSSTFSGLTSRCTTPARPAASSAEARSATIRVTSATGSFPSRSSRLPQALALHLVHDVVEEALAPCRPRGRRRCWGGGAARWCAPRRGSGGRSTRERRARDGRP